MGRHSASGDDEEDTAVALDEPTLDLAPRTRGRHSSRDEDAPDEQPTQMIAVVDAGLLEAHDTHDTSDTGQLPVLDEPPHDESHDLVPFEEPAVDEPPVGEPAGTDDGGGAEAAAADERKAAARAAKAQKKAARGETNTQADLRLLRTSTAVRAQCVAAVVVAFGLYTLVLAIIGRMSKYALFVWAPIVVSGVLIGVVLDLAHRRASATPTPQAQSETQTETQTKPESEPTSESESEPEPEPEPTVSLDKQPAPVDEPKP